MSAQPWLPPHRVPPGDADVARSAVAKVSRRLLPFLFLLYNLNFLDRVNVGFAALEMNRDLGFGPAVYGLGAGIFFLGYCLFEVPSNMIMLRTGARIWIARIMVSWGLVASAMMLVQTPASFYTLRALLGVAEAGFFPGIIFYLTYWYPARERARAYAWFLAAIPISGIVGGPISGALLDLHGHFGLAGWQWLFLLEGVPSVIVGLLVLVVLPDRPADARWLAPAERAWLERTLAEERAHAVAMHGTSFLRMLRNPTVWALATVYFLIIVGLYGVNLWLPQLIKGVSGLGNFAVGVVSTVPYIVAALGMAVVGASSDRSGERHWHIAGPALVAAGGFVLAIAARDAVTLVTALSLITFGVLSPIGPFWALPTVFLKEQAAAGGIALINSIGAIGGFVGPYLLGVVKDRTGGFGPALAFVALLCVVAAGIALRLRPPRPATEPAPA
ncbi:MAG TPA: MFS transporter [Gemmatimonadales bacterium]|nr:MFS transporter [Gemmatimonadales bacterium]